MNVASHTCLGYCSLYTKKKDDTETGQNCPVLKHFGTVCYANTLFLAFQHAEEILKYDLQNLHLLYIDILKKSVKSQIKSNGTKLNTTV